ncbi:MAG: hypothetical protein OEV30_05540 [Ignavibacteria bacterium]|nr:hypothetical protein [Ignavibacteria bacterium]
MTSRVVLLTCCLFIVHTSYTQEEGSPPGGKKFWSFLTEGNYKPFVEAYAGYGLMNHRAVAVTLPEIGIVGGKLGFREMRPVKRWGMRVEERFVIGAYGSSSSSIGSDGTSGLSGEYWRIGTGQRVGYGWTIARQPLIPYHQYSFNYMEPSMLVPSAITGQDSMTLARAVDGGRFAVTTEGGLHTELFQSIGISAGYEMSILYTRFVFAEWLGSYLIGASAVAVISAFSEEIVDSSPLFGPILYFVLRNGVAYGVFYASREQMNWPFSSETPLVIDAFKLDVSIKF